MHQYHNSDAERIIFDMILLLLNQCDTRQLLQEITSLCLHKSTYVANMREEDMGLVHPR